MDISFIRRHARIQNTRVWFCIATITELSNRLGFHLSHYDLIEDYRLDDLSLRYRFLVRLVGLQGWMIPKRLRCNTMVFGLELRV
jgi:hypothetical protein